MGSLAKSPPKSTQISNTTRFNPLMHIADPNVRVEPNDPNASWVEGGGEYNLKSQAGRWNANEGGWSPKADAEISNRSNPGDSHGPSGFAMTTHGIILHTVLLTQERIRRHALVH